MLRKTFVMLAFIAVMISNAFAQTAPPLKLTLRDAVQIALKANPEVQIANLNAAQIGQDRTIARSALLPQIELGISTTAERLNVDTFFGKHEIPQHIGPFEVFQAGSTFTAPVFDL